MQTAVAYEKISEIPKANGDLVDYHGDTLSHGRDSLMSRLNAKASEEITVRRGTLWFVGTLLVLAGVVFSYGSSAVAWVRDDESQRIKLANVERQVEEMRGEIKELTKFLVDQRVKDAVKSGYELKAAEGDHGKK